VETLYDEARKALAVASTEVVYGGSVEGASQ